MKPPEEPTKASDNQGDAQPSRRRRECIVCEGHNVSDEEQLCEHCARLTNERLTPLEIAGTVIAALVGLLLAVGLLMALHTFIRMLR